MTALIPYSRQCLDDDDVAAVVDALRADYLTTGPLVPAFESELAEYLGAKHVVVVNSGTAALHLALLAHGVTPGDEVLVPAMTFVATANAVLMCGAQPVFVDAQRDTLGIGAITRGVHHTDLTQAIVPVDLFGQPSHSAEIFHKLDVEVVVDAAHSLGATYPDGGRVGGRGTVCFSLHPVKTITTGEGGAIATDSDGIAEQCRLLRSHGRRNGEMVELGWNYRMSDIAAALGRSQLRKADAFLAQRRALARTYRELLAPLVAHGHLSLPAIDVERSSWHLFPVLFAGGALTRAGAAGALMSAGYETAVHYPPVHLQPYYRRRFRHEPGQHPVAEDAAARILSLPLWPGLTEAHVEQVVATLTKFFAHGGGH